MGWTEYYRRQEALDLVLEHGGELPYEAVADVFGSRRELLLALQYRWSQALRGRMDVALVEAARTPERDQVDAVATAWRRTAAEHPTLRRILDEHAAELTTARAAEQRWVAFAAGLAEPGEAAAETSRIGAAFLALVRNADQSSTATADQAGTEAERTGAGVGSRSNKTASKRTRRGAIEGLLRRVVAAH